jgi:hypothetical protein
MNAETLMLVGGVTAFALTLSWVRRRKLREKYAVGWVGLATLLLLLGLFPETIETAGQVTRLSYPAVVLVISLTPIYLFSFAVSVALSAQHRRSVRLSQQVAILEQRIRALESCGSAVETGTDNTSQDSSEMNGGNTPKAHP